MTPTVNKLLPVALVAALLGGTAGALISRHTTETTPTSPVATLGATDQPTPSPTNTAVPVEDKTALNAENGQDTYRDGFNDGFKAANEPRGSGGHFPRRR